MDIAAREKPDFVCRKMNRRVVTVGRFVADPEPHGARLGQAVTFSHRRRKFFSCMARLGHLFRIQI